MPTDNGATRSSGRDEDPEPCTENVVGGAVSTEPTEGIVSQAFKAEIQRRLLIYCRAIERDVIGYGYLDIERATDNDPALASIRRG